MKTPSKPDKVAPRVMRGSGNVFSDLHGHVRPDEMILAANGATYVRLRVWTNRPGCSDLYGSHAQTDQLRCGSAAVRAFKHALEQLPAGITRRVGEISHRGR